MFAVEPTDVVVLDGAATGIRVDHGDEAQPEMASPERTTVIVARIRGMVSNWLTANFPPEGAGGVW